MICDVCTYVSTYNSMSLYILVVCLSYFYIVGCSGSTLAFASHCVLDSSDNNRPVVGFMNICPLVSYLHVYIYTVAYVHILTGENLIT